MTSNQHCAVDGCERMAARSGLCWGHKKRQQRGQVVNSELAGPAGAVAVGAGGKPATPLERLMAASLAYAEADEDREYERAVQLLKKAGAAYGPGAEVDVEKLLKQEMARLGSLGGKTRAARMTPEERSEAARKTAEARWRKEKSE